jgi:hypothetical protein
MADRMYPAFPAGIETRFQAVKMTAGGSAAEIRAYLDDPACPYSLVLKDVIRGYLLGGGMGAGGAAVMDGNLAVAPLFQGRGSGSDQTDEERADGVLEEIQRTIDTMRNIEQSLDHDDTDGKLNIIKQKTALLEKWVSLKQGAFGIKQIGEFIRLVLAALDEHLDKDQIAALKIKIAALYEREGD